MALGIALLLNRKGVRGIGVFRTIFYLPGRDPRRRRGDPVALPAQPDQSACSTSRSGSFGIDGPGWFFDPAWAKNGIILMTIWAAGDVVIIYLGALQGVSRALYEAAEVDGAGAWVKLRHVTIPMISPAILFNLITGAIAAFQSFTQAFVISAGVGRGNDGSIGGVQNSLLFYGLNLYNNGFRYFQMGYASALAWILLVMILHRDAACFCAPRGTGSTTRARNERDRRRRGRATARSQRRRWSSRLSRVAPMVAAHRPRGDLPGPVRLDGQHVAEDDPAVDRLPAAWSSRTRSSSSRSRTRSRR